MHKIIPAQILVCHGSENKVYYRSCTLDIRMIHHTGWFKAGKDEFLYEFFQWNTILEPNGNRDSETVQHTSHRSAFFSHIDEDFTQGTISVLPCPQENNLSVDLRFLCKSTSFCRQCSAFNDCCQFSF